MSGRPSRVRQREIQQIVKGAMKAGATSVTYNIAGVPIVIAFPRDGSAEIPDDSNNSFDKIMRK